MCCIVKENNSYLDLPGNIPRPNDKAPFGVERERIFPATLMARKESV